MRACAMIIVTVCAGSVYAFDWPWKDRGDKAEPDTTAAATAENQSARDSKSVRATFLDTVNQGREIALAAGDVTPIVPDRPVQQSAEKAPVAADALPAQSKPPEVSLRSFRVQCLATTDIDRARAEKESLEARTRYKVQIFSDPPYYKVQAGNFSDRNAAEEAKKTLSEMGYRDAWIVKPIEGRQ